MMGLSLGMWHLRKAGGTGTIPFFFRANFNAPNQTLADATSLSTTANGIQDGIIYARNDGVAGSSVAISSNHLVVTSGAGDTFQQSAWINCYPKTKALAYQIRFSATNTAQQFINGLSIWQRTDSHPNFNGPSVNLFSDGKIYWNLGTGDFVGTFTLGGSLELAWVVGGYNSSGVPWDGVSDFSSYTWGANLYLYDGTNWILLFKTSGDEAPIASSASAYLDRGMTVTGASGASASISHMFVQDKDYSTVLVPTFLASAPSAGTTATGQADQFLEYGITLPASSSISMMFRRTDDNNTWTCNIASDGSASLNTIVSGSSTTQATAAAGIFHTGDQVRIVQDGTSVTVHTGSGVPNNASIAMSASSAANQSATGVKVSSLGTGGSLSYMAAYPRRGYTSFTPCQSISLANPRNNTSGSATKLVAFSGDSEVDPDQLHRESLSTVLQGMLGGSWTVTDRAAGGSAWSNLTADASNLDALFSGGNSKNWLFVWCGTNDFFTEADSVATNESEGQTYLAARVGTWGSNAVWLLSMLDRDQAGGAISEATFDADRTSWNSDMPTWAAGHGVNWLNLEVDSRLTDSTNQLYFRNDPTGVHINYSGIGIVARKIFDQITAKGL